MSAWLPVAGIVSGLLAGWFLFGAIHVPPETASAYAPYLSLAALAGLDTLLGGIRAGIEGRFQDDVFITGFVLNTLLAAGLAFLGDKIGVDLFLAAVVALGTRVFLNLSLIRRYFLNRRALAKRAEPAASGRTTGL
ncbi:MAG TPA: small basic family protein [Chthonomonadales bacterium]|nr:small basic family protein [Chthonomonadales bacterium]